jgi:MFS family permease
MALIGLQGGSTARGSGPGRRALLFRHRDFRLFWAGQTASVFGTQVTAVALPLLAALTLGAGAAGVSAVATASFLPNLAVPLFAGAWLESRRKRPAMITADLTRALALAIIPVAYGFGALSLPLLIAVAFTVGTLSVVFDVASFAYVPALVDDAELAAANRAIQGSATSAQVGGPGLAGVLVQTLGAPLAFVADAVSYVGSALGVAAARARETNPEQTTSAGILDGLRWLFANPILRALTAHAAIYNAASQIFTVNLVVYAVDDRGLSASLYGAALSAGGIGALIGTLAALALSDRVGYGRAFAGSLVLSTGAPLFVALVPLDSSSFAAALSALLLVAGIGLGSANVLSITLRQVIVPATALARSNGGYRLLIFGSIPIGSILGGLIGHAAGTRAGVAAGAAGLTLSALPMFRPEVRTLREPPRTTLGDADAIRLRD